MPGVREIEPWNPGLLPTSTGLHVKFYHFRTALASIRISTWGVNRNFTGIQIVAVFFFAHRFRITSSYLTTFGRVVTSRFTMRAAEICRESIGIIHCQVDLSHEPLRKRHTKLQISNRSSQAVALSLARLRQWYFMSWPDDCSLLEMVTVFHVRWPCILLFMFCYSAKRLRCQVKSTPVTSMIFV